MAVDPITISGTVTSQLQDAVGNALTSDPLKNLNAAVPLTDDLLNEMLRELKTIRLILTAFISEEHRGKYTAQDFNLESTQLTNQGEER